MREQYIPVSSTRWMWWVMGTSILLNLLLVIVIVFILVPTPTHSAPITSVQVGNVVVYPTATPGVRPTPEGDVRIHQVSSVLAWRRTISRLETKEFGVVADVVAPRMGGMLGIGSESVQVHLVGTVVGRTDLSKLTIDPDFKTGDITISPDGRTISIVLPAPNVSKPFLDENQSSFNNHTLGFFTSADPKLWQEGHAKATFMLVEKACEEGIIEQTRSETEQQIRTILGLGFSTVYVQTRQSTQPCGQ